MKLGVQDERRLIHRRRAIDDFAKKIGSYAAYYNEVRTHMALSKDAPLGRRVQESGVIVAIPVLSGLHHHYKDKVTKVPVCTENLVCRRCSLSVGFPFSSLRSPCAICYLAQNICLLERRWQLALRGGPKMTNRTSSVLSSELKLASIPMAQLLMFSRRTPLVIPHGGEADLAQLAAQCSLLTLSGHRQPICRDAQYSLARYDALLSSRG